MFKINTFGHLLTYKHFVPLLPSKSAGTKTKSEEDPAKPYVQPGLNVLASISARVGSIEQNEKGGWYSCELLSIQTVEKAPGLTHSRI